MTNAHVSLIREKGPKRRRRPQGKLLLHQQFRTDDAENSFPMLVQMAAGANSARP